MDNPQNKEENDIIRVDLEGTSDSSVSSIKSLSETVASAMEASNRLSEMIRPVVDSMTKVLVNTDYFLGMRDTLSALTKRIAEAYTFDFSSVIESMTSFSERISEMLKNIHFPEITEERKKQLIESHRQWGEYGWTINPCADYETLFDSVPDNKKDADSKAMKYCGKKYMPSIFEEIRKCKRVKKSDFEEAVFAFESSKYKSCALLLFSLIDAQLIRLQKKSDFDDQQQRRKVGKGAVIKAKARAENDLSESMLLTAMFYSNLFSCLAKVFEDGRDFKEQPQVINRNFLDHGMMTKRVSRKNCVQLFLLYYNMLCMLDTVY